MKKTLLILLAISLIHAQSIEIKPEIKEKQKTEHQTVQYDIYTGQSLKISTPGGFESFHLTLNSDVSDINHPLCKVVERQIKFENVTYLNIYEGQFDSHGLLMNEIPITIGWTSIKPNIKNTNKGIASLDDSLDLYIFMIDDILDKDYYGSQLLGRISMKELYPDYKMLEDEVFLVEARGIIFMFFQSKLIMYDTIKKTKNLVPGYKGDKELKKVLVYYFGQVTMFYIAHGLGGFSAYKMNHAPGLENISLELLFDSDVNNDKKMNIVDINMYEYKMTLNKQEISMMSIYVLDYNSGLHLYDQNFADDIIEPKDIQKKTSVFIPYEQGILFGMCKDETFLIVGSEFGNNVATEIEFDEQANEYFINRKHEVENEIQDILVAENYAILLGSNTHTIIWHSVNSKIIQDMSPLYSQFSLYGYNGGVFFEGPYDERLGKSVDFFAGLQRRHLFVVKIIEQDPYFECDASDQQIQDLVGNHNLLFDVKYNCPTIEEPNSNSYCSHTQNQFLV
ncbi:hypothetical protein IMG5_074230 [Ichthyophthirius multifiliis]|uniref:Uncharacterized protein n=1 Tax=Ichthyophthirius multifiliis TaxID=5932 RepID=G0QQ16_ICHMU|nr:hypothetical protein IMG5_074230 [Ichthyophthirius multifiliis]EGR32686.1 hypothetical protein IMG5_074230 [Ichthyophthirius multifiliis]|eukprot:XP_004036672.1 hypothetical protein IMG5_074230 [Ichthyophthirius multifiliis]